MRVARAINGTYIAIITTCDSSVKTSVHRIAAIQRTGVIVVAINRSVYAASCRNTIISRANRVVVTINICIEASCNGIAAIERT